MRMFETEEAQESMSTPAPAAAAGTAPDAQSEGAGSEEAIPAGPATIPSEVAPGSAPPPEVLATAAATGAINAGPAPSAPTTTGPPPFVGAAPSLAAAGEEPAPVAPGDQAAGPAPGVAYEGIPLVIEEGE
jgi:hypothetical protein